MPVYIRNSDGTLETDKPIGPKGLVARVEFWLRARGFTTIPNALGRWDERKLGK